MKWDDLEPMPPRHPYNDHPDPEYQRWARTYPPFPGVEECVRLVLADKATGAWKDIVVMQLAEHAEASFDELTNAFTSHPGTDVPLIVMMAFELAKLPASVVFLGQVLNSGDERLAEYARRTLTAIDTREARTMLFTATRRVT